MEERGHVRRTLDVIRGVADAAAGQNFLARVPQRDLKLVGVPLMTTVVEEAGTHGARYLDPSWIQSALTNLRGEAVEATNLLRKRLVMPG